MKNITTRPFFKEKKNFEEQLLTNPNILSTIEIINQKSLTLNSPQFLKVNLENFDFESENNYEFYFDFQNSLESNINNNDVICEKLKLKNFFLIRNKNEYVNLLDSPSSIKAIKKLKYSIKDLVKIPFNKFTTIFTEFSYKGKEKLKNAYNIYEKQRLEKILECKFERKNVIEFETHQTDSNNDQNHFIKKMYDVIQKDEINDSSIDDDNKFIGGRIRNSFNNICNSKNENYPNNKYESILMNNNFVKKSGLNTNNNITQYDSREENIKKENYIYENIPKINDNYNSKNNFSNSKVNIREIEENLYSKENFYNKTKRNNTSLIEIKNFNTNKISNNINRNYTSKNSKINCFLQISKNLEENNLKVYDKSCNLNSKSLEKIELSNRKIFNEEKNSAHDTKEFSKDRESIDITAINQLIEKINKLKKEHLAISKNEDNKTHSNLMKKQEKNTLYEKEIKSLEIKINKIEEMINNKSSNCYSKDEKRKIKKVIRKYSIDIGNNRVIKNNNYNYIKNNSNFKMGTSNDDFKDESEKDNKHKNKIFYFTLQYIQSKLANKFNNNKKTDNLQLISNNDEIDNNIIYNQDENHVNRFSLGLSTNKIRQSIPYINNKIPYKNKSSANRVVANIKNKLELKDKKIIMQLNNKKINKNDNLIKNNNGEKNLENLNINLEKEQKNKIEDQINQTKMKDSQKEYIYKYRNNSNFHQTSGKNFTRLINETKMSLIDNYSMNNWTYSNNRNFNDYNEKNTELDKLNKNEQNNNFISEYDLIKESFNINDSSSANHKKNNDLNEFYIKSLIKRIYDKNKEANKRIMKDRFQINYKTNKSLIKITHSPTSMQSIWNKTNSDDLIKKTEICKSSFLKKDINEELKIRDNYKIANNKNYHYLDKMNQTRKNNIKSEIEDYDLYFNSSNKNMDIKKYLKDIRMEKNCELIISQFKGSLDKILESKLLKEKESDITRREKAKNTIDPRERKKIDIINAQERFKASQELIQLNK